MAKPATSKAKSIEAEIQHLGDTWLKNYYGDQVKLEQADFGNAELDEALKKYFSKNGGTGANRPDAKLLLQHGQKFYPILIEYKGYADKLEKCENGTVHNRNDKGEPIFKNINGYAVNGAVHYANAILHHTNYQEVIAIGMTGGKDEQGKIAHQIAVYYVAKSNFGAGQKVDGEFSDFSFLAPENFPKFIEKVLQLNLTEEELANIKAQRENEIESSLTKLNNDIYNNEKGLGEAARVYLVAASVIANLGVDDPDPEKYVSPLEAKDLSCLSEKGNRDGDIMMRKIAAFLEARQLPKNKKDLIIRTIETTVLADNINKPINGETQLKRIFSKVVDDLGFYYKIGLTTDFTGKLFNEMYAWLGFSQDKLNDVVLTPSYVATFLAKLARVNRDSYVWDFAMGSAGLLVAAMHEMLRDAKEHIQSPDELRQKEANIKAEQLLGLEILPEIYMLAVLNMILMGDGSSNILNQNSIDDFSGEYAFKKDKTKFPADVFILNPPYSAAGNGMVFVEKALNMMHKGYAAVIIQDSAGSGKASEFNRRILKRHSLIASIKMPTDLFIGKSSVQTSIYVFKANEAHHAKLAVKFIDFSNDGYKRASRKKAKASSNLRDQDNAQARYQEVVDLVHFGRTALKLLTENEYVEDRICLPENDDKERKALEQAKIKLDAIKQQLKEKKIKSSDFAQHAEYQAAQAAYEQAKTAFDAVAARNAKVGNDWNFNQHKKIDTKPTLSDFKKTVSDYLAWEVSQILKQGDAPGKTQAPVCNS